MFMDIDTFSKLHAFDNPIMNEIGKEITLDNIEAFFAYDDAFWHYLKSKTSKIDSHHPNARCFYGVYPDYDSSGILSGMSVVVPIIIDMATALINVHEFRHAFELYEHLGEPYHPNVEISEQIAGDAETSFSKQYVLSKGSKWLEEQTLN